MGNLIHRQILELKFSSQQEAQHSSARISELNRTIILEELDRTFTELSGDRTLRIERLELDLGQLSQATLEDELRQRIRQRAKEALQPYLPAVDGEADGTAAAEFFKGPEGRPLLRGSSQSLDAGSLEELFSRFLQTGQVPWWLKQELIAQLDRLYQRFWQLAPERAGKLIMQTIAGPIGLLRFVEQFSNRSHQLTLQELLPPVAGTLLVDLRKLATYLLAKQGFGLQARRISHKLAYSLISISDQRHFDQPQLMVRQFFFTLAQISDIPAERLREEVDAVVSKLRITSATRALLAELLRESNFQLKQKNGVRQLAVGSETPDKQDSLAASTGLEEVYIENAGLVLLWPHLNELFRKLDLLETPDDGMLRPKVEAVLLLQQLVTGRPAGQESLLLLNKLLCGIPPSTPVPRRRRRVDGWDTEVENLLQAAIRQWSALKNTSVDGLRRSFLQREGILREQGEGWQLQVERKAHDILLEQIPWGFGVIRLSWMPQPLIVEW
jgi:hypothetical protein